MKIVGFDTETVLTKDGKYYTHKFYSAQFYSPDLGINRFLTDPEKVASFFRSKSRNAVLLANNAEFDFGVLAKILDRDYFKLRCLYNKGRFIYGKVQRKRNCWNIVDLGNIFVFWSLKRIGDFVGLPKLEKPHHLGERPPLTFREKRYFQEYAMRDAQIGYAAGKWLLNTFGDVKITLPALGFWVFNKKYQPKGLYLTVKQSLEEKLRRSYRGGRCEAWVRGTPDKKVYVYDRVSLYPFAMLKNAYPVGIHGLTKKHDINLYYEGIAKCKIQQETEIPFLATKTLCPDKYTKLLFPNGTFTDWFTYPELRYFKNQQLGKILKVYEAYETKQCRFYFKNYVHDFFKLKNEDKEHSDFWKLMLNSLYGKFAQDVSSPELLINEDGSITKTEKKRKNFRQNILASAYITAYGRIEMHKLFRKIGASNLVYTDTDSLHSFVPISEIGSNLGDLKFEYDGFGTYIRSKFYIIDDKVRCRGMERIFKAEHIKKMIADNDVTVMSTFLLRLRSAFRQHKPFLTQKEQEKHFSLNFDFKRTYQKALIGEQLLNDYALSEPVRLKNGNFT